MTRNQLLELPAAVDVTTAAAAYGCSEWTVRERIRRGELPCLRLGRLVKVRAVDIYAELLGMAAPDMSEGAPASAPVATTDHGQPGGRDDYGTDQASPERATPTRPRTA